MCEVFEVSRSGYYAWRSRQNKEAKDQWLIDLIAECQKQCKQTYGIRRVRRWIQRRTGKLVNTKAILRVMRKLNLLSVIRRCRPYTRYQQAVHKYPNLLDRNFDQAKPNQFWVTDITYIPIPGNMLYMCAVLDLCGKVVLAWKIGTNMSSSLVTDTIREALQQEKVTGGLALHSDQGSQYTSQAYFDLMQAYHVLPSMSSPGCPYDNAAMENFFGTLKAECFIVTAGLFSERSDTLTVLPLLEHFQEKTGELPNRLITDSGYESEENYTRLEEMGIEAYIKPVNYEISKTKKYQRDRYKAENMPYDEETDSFICPNGNTLTAIGTAHRKSKSGFLSEVTLYRCTECRNCPLKAECTKSKNGRTIQRSKVLQRQREQSRERITSELGIQLRVNRSIQSEGTFGVLKQDWGFRRFLRRGQKNVYTEILIYAFAFNIQKLYAKDTNQRHGVILHQLKNAS